MDAGGDAVVSKVTDEEAARQLGRTLGAVARKRNLLRIPGSAGVPPWTKKELTWLGNLSDAEVAARTGRTLCGVILKRRKLADPRRIQSRAPGLPARIGWWVGIRMKKVSQMRATAWCPVPPQETRYGAIRQ
jgi:hypothetical protein